MQETQETQWALSLGWEHPLGVGNGNPLQYSCLENSMDGGAWWAIVHGVACSWTGLSDCVFVFVFYWCVDSWILVASESEAQGSWFCKCCRSKRSRLCNQGIYSGGTEVGNVI